MSAANTPVRRSLRHNNQPVVRATHAFRPGISHKWSGAPLYTRALQPDSGLPAATSGDDSDDDSEDQTEAIFYEGFIRSRDVAVNAGSKGKGKSSEERYKVGDTVLVNTHTSVRFPSVGVITSVWQEGPVVVPLARPELMMKVKIHWFLRLINLLVILKCLQTFGNYRFPGTPCKKLIRHPDASNNNLLL